MIEIISSEGVLLDFQHANSKDYPNQRLMVVAIDDYPHCIPYVMDEEKFDVLTSIQTGSELSLHLIGVAIFFGNIIVTAV